LRQKLNVDRCAVQLQNFFNASTELMAVWLNWRNSKMGYWINLIAISATDVGFILFVLMPGYLPLWPGVLGPVFWVFGMFFATAGILREKTA